MPNSQDEDVVVLEKFVLHDVRKTAELRSTGVFVNGRTDFRIPFDLGDTGLKAL